MYFRTDPNRKSITFQQINFSILIVFVKAKINFVRIVSVVTMVRLQNFANFTTVRNLDAIVRNYNQGANS